MHIAPLTPVDLPAYRHLMLHAYEHAADAFTSTVEERAAEPESWWLRRIADPAGLSAAFGAFEGDELIGTVALSFSSKPKTRHKADVVGMYVLAPRRSEGVGRALLQAAIDHAEARSGLRALTLTVTQGNAAAMGLYEACGFEVFGVEPMAILTPSGLLSKVYMRRELVPRDAACP